MQFLGEPDQYAQSCQRSFRLINLHLSKMLVEAFIRGHARAPE